MADDTKETFGSFPGMWRRLGTLNSQLTKASKNPLRGVTQGKSSGKNAGAKPAARNSDIYRGTQKDRSNAE